MARAQEDVISIDNPGSTKQELAALQSGFLGFRISREETCGRIRYVARRRHEGLHPHTMITADLGELRRELETTGTQADFSPDQPNIARIYDYLLQGKDNFRADRQAAGSVLARFPEIAEIARANRAFLARAVRHVARQGVCQFIDVGAGLPANPRLHEVARKVTRNARVVYADNDPVVLAHAGALLTSDPGTAVVAADIRDPDALLAAPSFRAIIDLEQPVCILLTAVPHFLPPAEADAAAAAFRRLLAPGSCLVISVGTATGTDPELIRCLQAAYAGTAPVTGRTAAEINAWFAGLILAGPGLTDVWAWRPENPRSPVRPGPARARFLVGVGRKPVDSPA
jgi:hypothetical protein